MSDRALPSIEGVTIDIITKPIKLSELFERLHRNLQS
jgi:hypothetical protein